MKLEGVFVCCFSGTSLTHASLGLCSWSGILCLVSFILYHAQMRMKKWTAACKIVLFFLLFFYMWSVCVCVDLYQQVFHESPVVERLLQRLMEVLGREAELQQEFLQVLGIMDTLFASLTPRKEVAALAAPPVAQESQLQAAWHSLQNSLVTQMKHAGLWQRRGEKWKGKRKETNTRGSCGKDVAQCCWIITVSVCHPVIRFCWCL